MFSTGDTQQENPHSEKSKHAKEEARIGKIGRVHMRQGLENPERKSPKSRATFNRIQRGTLNRAETENNQQVKPNPSCGSSGELIGVNLRDLLIRKKIQN